ncbi:MAG: LAGLIDADG family homing endonuclease [Acidiferrobacterales bacterium]
MKRIPLKYLAGLIDGEGCIDLNVTTQVTGSWTIRPRVRIAMAVSSRDLLCMLQQTHGGHLSHRRSKNPAWQDSLAWEVAGYKRCCMLLRQVVNHLILKKEQAQLCLWMERNIKNRQVSTEVRDALRDEMKLMKKDPHRLSEKAQQRVLGIENGIAEKRYTRCRGNPGWEAIVGPAD